MIQLNNPENNREEPASMVFPLQCWPTDSAIATVLLPLSLSPKAAASCLLSSVE